MVRDTAGRFAPGLSSSRARRGALLQHDAPI